MGRCVLAIKSILDELREATISRSIHCNNQHAVDQLNKLHENYPATVSEANKEEHEHLYQINKLQKTLPPIGIFWVKGYVKNPTCLAEHLNVHADIVAKANRLRSSSN